VLKCLRCNMSWRTFTNICLNVLSIFDLMYFFRVLSLSATLLSALLLTVDWTKDPSSPYVFEFAGPPAPHDSLSLSWFVGARRAFFNGLRTFAAKRPRRCSTVHMKLIKSELNCGGLLSHSWGQKVRLGFYPPKHEALTQVNAVNEWKSKHSNLE
jgi:hypothetical protein